ncbi:MAG: flagellar filament capping protein FliD, partial [Deltaproteobacteria bacterium]|nr:flagellar filament capping protein FliD [Deltaproteobacteria bacterium]
RFTLRTRTSTIQPPHDALIRFGATALGGGLEVTSSKNEMSDVIDGVRLNLIRPDDKPVTVTIRGETEKAVELVKGFVNDYNQLAEVINELTKFDKDNNLAGPLLSNREVTDIRTQIADQIMNPVAGLPKNANMLMTLGARLNDKGIMTLDENLLMKKVTDDFALVSDLFRSKGDSDNSAIGFVGMTPETQVNADGYEVDITQIATQGHYVTQPIAGSILIDASNNRFALSVDGRESDMIEMPQQEYSLTDFAKKLQDAVTNDKRIGEMNVRVMVEGDRIKVYSGRYGANTSIAFTSGTNNPLAHNILLGGTSIAGQDVQGTVGGVPGEGNGILLKVPEKSGPASGIRLIVRVTADQLKMEGPEARIKVTRGIAGRLQTYLEGLVHPMKGTMTNISKGLSDRVSNLDVQLGRMEERINSKRERLQDKFTRMESQMSKLKSQQSAMASQMGGGKGIPGLPGL